MRSTAVAGWLGTGRPVGIKTGDVIRYVRIRQGLSARALSLAAGLSESYVGKIEHGDCIVSLPVFSRIALVLGMSDQEIAMVVRWAAEGGDNRQVSSKLPQELG